MVKPSSDSQKPAEALTYPDLKPLVDWFDIHRPDYNWRESNDPYKVWVSEVMSQQTRAETVSLYFLRFMERFPTIQDLAAAPEDDLLKIWEGLGYYSRARNLQKTARIVVDELGGELPRTAHELRKLPGIGPYTAGAIASFCYAEAEPAVDGNTVRITSRLLDLDFTQGDVKDRNTTYQILDRYMAEHPDEEPGPINESFMILGAMVCIPRAPKCDHCPMQNVCLAYHSGRAPQLPRPKKGKKLPVELLTVVILETADGRFLLEQRGEGLLHGLWQFLYFDGHITADELLQRLDVIGLEVSEVVDLAERRHIFSHLIWEQIGYHIRLKQSSSDPNLVDLLQASKSIDESLVLKESIDDYLAWPAAEIRAFVTAEEGSRLAFSSALSEYLPWR